MRIGDDRLLDVLLHARASAAISGDELDLDTGAVLLLELHRLLAHHVGLVVLGVDPQVNLERGAAFAGLAGDDDGLAGRELPVEPRRADPYPLLPARLLEAVQLRTVETL